ncbi:hypothetical protein HK096_002403 [Nowakowskiella sp. JEL0078]|nr:hypothetical protein HK096_002403 [Nowakowskiella sp. JEL0078]
MDRRVNERIANESILTFYLKNEHFRHSLAGAIAGCASAIASCPFDVVKVRKQNHQIKPLPANPLYPNKIRYPGTFSSLKKVYQKEGLRGLYRGVGPTVAGYLPTWAIYFGAYGWSKNWLASKWDRKESDSIVHVFAAMFSGTASSIAVNPLWVVRTRIMTQPAIPTSTTPYHYNSTLEALSTITRVEGFWALYKGLGPSLMGVSHVAIQFPLYELLKNGSQGLIYLISLRKDYKI